MDIRIAFIASFMISACVDASKIDVWRKELDRAKTVRDLQILRKKINKKRGKRHKLSQDEISAAQIFIDVIDRKLMPKSYLEDHI